MRKLTIALLLALVVPAVHAQTAYLVKDLNTTRSSEAQSSGPKAFFRHGSRVYFSAYTHATGTELFATDGTEAGTAMVADIAPGPSFSSPSRFIEVNGNLLFNARDSRGEELWTTNGTAAGTRLMADINPFASSTPGDRIVFNGRMLFAAQESTYGRELWITDGTSAGTKFFKDLAPGPNDSSPQDFVLLNGTVYFSANDALWKSDGTEAGTVVVKSGFSPYGLTAAGNRIFFWAYTNDSGAEPWVSDGTEAGTFMLADIGPGRDGSAQFGFLFLPFGNRILFVPHSRDYGMEWWISDGTSAGTHILRDIHPGRENGAGPAIVMGDKVLFSAVTPQTGWELWQTDGTSAGTVLFRDLVPGPASSGASNFVDVNGSVYFATNGQETDRIWVTDGTPDGTRPVTGTEPVLDIGSAFANIDGTLYFSGANALHGFEPWKSDGTAAGTTMIANIARDSAPSSDPAFFKAAGDWVYFDAWDGFPNEESSSERETFWRSDGTPEGTVEVAERGPTESDHVSVGRTLVFVREYEPWISDGTREGTKRATELIRRFPERPYVRFALGDTLFVNSDENLWMTKLAPGSPVVQLDSEWGWSFAELAGRAVYFSDGIVDDYPLWISDGTPEGTFVVKMIPTRPDRLVTMGGHTYFTTFYEGAKLWRTDGTSDGTIVVAPLPEAGNSLVAAGKNLFFVDGRDGTLWVSDGTQAGTRELPATPNRDSGLEVDLAPIGDSVVFTASDATNGMELWISDGTPEGTRMLFDIHPGAQSSTPTELRSAGGRVYFRAFSPLSGYELWVTDGTAAGTKLAADIEPGTGSGYPQSLTAAGGRLFFAASTVATGKELWALPLALGPRMRIEDARVPETAATARLRVTLSAAAAQTVTVEYTTSNGTAAEGSDYDAASGTLTFAPGETSKTIDVPVHGDAARETNETFLVTLRNASGATIEHATAAGIIEDDDQRADVSIAPDFTFLSSFITNAVMKNDGPSTATNLRPRLTMTPSRYVDSFKCSICRYRELLPGETERAFEVRELGQQLYVTATVDARENDPNPANNTTAWTVAGSMAMDALHLTPGSQANLWVSGFGTLTLESSDPSVVSVPPSVMVQSGSASVVARGLKAGTATIRANTATGGNVGTLVVHVIEPGTKQRWPGGVEPSVREHGMPFDRSAELTITATGTAPFTGETATGVATISANGRELARVELRPGSRQARVPFYFPEVGSYTLTFHYAGDANFLPMTFDFPFQVRPGNPTIHATATRNGTNVVVRARVSGSPMAAPTGTITVGSAQVPLTAIGPGLAEAEVTLQDVAAATTVLSLRYSGDTRYNTVTHSVPITTDRRRTTRH